MGYVGLPLALALARHFPVIGFDIDRGRVEELRRGVDRTREAEPEALRSSSLKLSADPADLPGHGIYIVTVPTPVDAGNKPDLGPVRSASRSVGQALAHGAVPGAIVVFESTVYPGVTEEICGPIIAAESGLTCGRDFFLGYSPERINPGDRERRVNNIKKVTSGSTPEIAERVDQLYRKIIKAGTHKASSLKVAEAAKVIENSQRDINIAFVNELAMIFERVGIDTTEVLEAAGTKWNFLPFKPGLVGGHCIGVDPYYLTYKAEGLGYRPEVILSGRRINDNMGIHIATCVVKLMARKELPINKSEILVLGITFKENCPDIRNSRVIDVIRELQSYGATVEVYDPLADSKEVEHEYGLKLVQAPSKKYHAIVLAVSHDEFTRLDWDKIRNHNTVVYDVKSFLDRSAITARL